MTPLEFVERERARLRRLHIIAGASLALAVTFAVLALGVLVLGNARWIALPRSSPFVVWLVVGALDIAVIVWSVRRLRGDVTSTGVAATIEREQALRAGALRGALEVADRGALGRHAANEMSNKLRGAGATLAPTSRRSARRQAGRTFAAASISVVLLAALTPVFGDGLLALFLPVKAWNGTLLPKLEFRGLPHEIMRGEDLKLEITAPRRSQVTLSQRTTGEGWRTTTLPVSRDGLARTQVGPVRGALTLVVSDGRASTDTAIVRVTDRPFVGAISMRAIYPEYLGRASEGLPVGEPARVPQGTVVDIAGRASTELKNVRLVSPKSSIELHPNGHAFTGRFTATQTGKWNWSAVGSFGPIADVPLPLELEVVPDSAPRVELVSPASDTLVAGSDRIPLRLTVTDDHGIARVELESWKQGNGTQQPKLVQLLSGPQATVWNGAVFLDLAPRELQPGDALHVKVVATDNSPWAQKGASRELLLKIPTMEERRAMARDAADSAVREAQSAASAQRALQQRTDDAARDRGQRGNSNRNGDNSSSSDSKASGGDKGSMSYEAAEQARAVAKDQRALTDRVKSLEEQAKALEQQLKQAGALDSTLARQLRDAQELLRQALTPELMEQMKKLEDAAQQLSGDQARQAMKDLAAMQQRLREQLEKSAEMLKRAAFEGAMQTLKDEAKDIADRERKLADSAKAKGDSASEAQQNQARQLAERSDRFSDEVKKLEDRLAREKADPGAKRADEARQHGEASAEKMKQAAGDRSTANQQQNGRDSLRAGTQPNEQQRSTDKQRQNGKQSSQTQAGGDQQRGDGQQSAQGQNGKPSNSAQGQRGQQGQSGQRGQNGQQGGDMQENTRDAAAQMEQAAQAMQDARDAQVSEWKKELTGDLDQTIQELLQMAREESAMEQKARSGDGKNDEMRGQQSAVKQGVDEAAQRMQKAGQKSSLLSGRSQRAMAEAQQKVAQATQQMTDQRGASQSANSLGEAAESLNRAAASLARDRERVNSASSASGFSEMLQQLQEMAKKQGSINAQAQGLMPMPGGQMSSEMQATARALARQQRSVAQQLDEMGEGAGGDRAAQLAREARQLADALEGGRIDGTTLARQQQLFRRLLDAGRSLEKDEREDSNKREAKAAKGDELFTPMNTDATGKNASKFREPNWNELRGLTADERRAILDYFKRINEQKP
ncbi:MAG TPA: hypothetical protein VJN70_11205 [Gemmatimonadaceae bacterium]|nr:hypothetical protein [Gemmatimonadaceae bacterium]